MSIYLFTFFFSLLLEEKEEENGEKVLSSFIKINTYLYIGIYKYL